MDVFHPANMRLGRLVFQPGTLPQSLTHYPITIARMFATVPAW